jgi:N-acetylglucosaminyldiphosphoundecaprenol N-acetyl-beta-D-mannosaminyltransferase
MSEGILAAVRAKTRGYVCVANAHMMVTARQRPELAQALRNALYVTSDGMPLVWTLRSKGWSAERVAGPDLTVRLCEEAAKAGVPVYFYGSGPETLRTLVEAVKGRFPGLRVAGAESPPRLDEKPAFDAAAAGKIADSGAGLVFVGLGCPKQELWMAAHSAEIPAVLVGVGAAFDFLAGSLRRAPLWMQKCGLEWLFRLLMEPRRLWKRYLVTNSLFLWYSIRGKNT